MDIILIIMFLTFLTGVWIASEDLDKLQRLLLIITTSIVVIAIVSNGY
ncbi:hypothetical protein OAT15_02915 [Gammaproteobacteria bacterium]|jgi:uncharacterized membrane protein|nr:hypothetical protein [Gammaproteobacteria bacterium]MDC1123983.1 hypothetical protein [Gammaproteobacteria bacterium]